MLRVKILVLTIVLSVGHLITAPSAEAGPLLDWFRGLRRNRNTCCQQRQQRTPLIQRQTARFQGAVTPNSLQPGQCARTCNQTCSRVVVNYVPYTAYRTSWKQVPVTQFRPQTSSDPCTGCTVTCMRPCTSYTWQMQRVPYTTYRQVQRTENYTVPVTTITNDCATGTCSSCPTGTCGQVQQAPVQNFQNFQGGGSATQGLPQSSSVIAPNGTIGTNGNFQSSPIPQFNGGVPAADSAPFIDSNVNPQINQRPLFDRIETQPLGGSASRTTPTLPPLGGSASRSNSTFPAAAPQNNVFPINSPAVINFGNQTADASPLEKKWDYSPVRLASYTQTEEAKPAKRQLRQKPVQISGRYEAIQARPQANRRSNNSNNSAWKTVEW